MSKKYMISLILGTILIGVTGMAKAITWGAADSNVNYPNVVSVRGIIEAENKALVSCSGSLLHIDGQKIVILTAAHCTDIWMSEIAAGHLNSVGVSFDPNNVIDESITDATYYVRGGVPISMPEKDSPFEKFDYGFVVFSQVATNFKGETIGARWGGTPGALTPVQLPPYKEYLSDLIKSVKNAANDLFFTAVGYGTGERFPIPGKQTGPADPSSINFDPFLIRHIANNLSYNAHNPVNDVLRLSQNIAKSENGTCSGDSGGPIFYNDGFSLIQVSLVSGGDAPCRATTTGPGFSRQEALNFINCGKVGVDTTVQSCLDALDI
jgi:hypothetical protein